MPDTDDQNLAKGDLFFIRAHQVAQTNNFDYAIDMYLEGLRCFPDAVLQGHIPLHEWALLRQSKGGKKPSMLEKVRYMRGKTPLDRMLNAERLFAKHPDHLPYAEAMLKPAIDGGYKETARWVADFLFDANNAAQKPSLQTYLLIKDAYAEIGLFERAIAACQYAVRLKPEDKDLADEYHRLSAELTLAKGKYENAGDFRDSIKDRQSQEKLQAQAGVVKTDDYRVSAADQARQDFAQDPNLRKNIVNLAQTLSDLHNDQAENEAIGLLENAYKSKSDFSFKEQAGQIRLKQLRRKIKDAKKAFEIKPDDKQARDQLLALSSQLNSAELEHYRLCFENYPTDLQIKYEYGVRLVRNKRYDEAIPLFQEAQKDPRRKIAAMDKIGLCFFMKGWFTDAIDIFNNAINSYELKEDSLAKEMRYNLARAYQEKGDSEKALEIYRRIAQLDFAYKDVRQRIDKLREAPETKEHQDPTV